MVILQNNNSRSAIDAYSNKLDELMELFDLSEILEQSDLTDRDVVYILYHAGHLNLPPYLEDFDTMEQEEGTWDTDSEIPSQET